MGSCLGLELEDTVGLATVYIDLQLARPMHKLEDNYHDATKRYDEMLV